MQRQLALKSGLILLLSLLLLIPLNLIEGQITARSASLESVKHDIADSWTGEQQLMTPVLVQPYQVRSVNREARLQTRYALVPARHVHIVADARSEYRARGIYRVPVYTAALKIDGRVSVQRWVQQRESIQLHSEFERFLPPYLAVHLSDPRGIDNRFTTQLNGTDVSAIPGAGVPSLSSGFRMMIPAGWETLATDLEFNLQFDLRGMADFRVVPATQSLSFRMQSDWPHPKFTGVFLPREHLIDGAGFRAAWSVNEFSSGANAKLELCQNSDCSGLLQTGFGVEFFESVDIYQQAERAVKYGVLFIAITFVSFFLFESLRSLRIHPFQYTLVGLSLAIFYLLLISLSEHMAFHWAYVIAVFACCSLLFGYLSRVLTNTGYALAFCVCLLGLHSMLYVILQLEDFALLMGALLLFVLLAVLMLSTRDIDWYTLPGVAGADNRQGELFKSAI